MRKALLLDTLPDYRHTEQNAVRDFRFELITPMFGGDSVSWELNLNAPVRAQSVKGQLRFWWRTMQTETDPKELLRKENEIWGGKTTGKERIQAPVKIAVLNQDVKKVHQAELNESGFAVQDEVIPTYVAFPVTSAIKRDRKDVHYVQSVTFTLRITFPVKFEKTVLDTLTLWMLFGGVGARTRRGCGSVYCEELMASFPDEKAIAQFIRSFGSSNKTAVPKIHGAALACSPAPNDAPTAWFNLIRSYSGFRQDRTPRKPTPGRSFWPEPDAIRRVVRQQSKQHTPGHPDDVWFPRAAYGLPILTKFNTKGNGAGDPDPQVELVPAQGERWPSPLILKAIRLPDGKVLNTALVLNQSFPEKLVLKQGRSHFDLPESALPLDKNLAGKVIKAKEGWEPANGKNLYQILFRELNLKEVV